MELPKINNYYDWKAMPFELSLVNNIPVYSIADTTCELVKIEIYLTKGVKYQEKAFIAKVATDMLLEGSVNYPNELLQEAFQNIGASVYADCGKDYVVLTAVVLKQYVAKLMDLLIELLHHPLCSQEAFNRIVQRYKNAYEMGLHQAKTIASKLFLKEIFVGHQYGKYAVHSDFDALSLDEVKIYLQTFPKSIKWIFISGNITTELQDKLKHFKSSLLKEKVLSLTKTLQIPSKIIKTDEGFNQETIKVGQTLSLPKSVPELVRLKLCNLIYGGYFGSRLMQKIREEKGYTYGINSSLLGMESSGYFMISSDLKLGTYMEVFEALKQEMCYLQQNVLPEIELEKLKKYYLGALLQATDGVFEQMELLKNNLVRGVDPNEFALLSSSIIKETTPQDLLKVFNQYFLVDTWTYVVVA